MKNVEKSFALLVGGLTCLYFAWLFSATGIFVAGRSHVAVTAADEPDRFAFGVAATVALGAVSLIGGLVTTLRR